MKSKSNCKTITTIVILCVCSIVAFENEFVCCRVYPPLGPSSSRRCDRALSSHSGPEVQLRQDDLPQVLRSSPPQSHQLPKEELWPHIKHQAQEEAEVNFVYLSSGGLVPRSSQLDVSYRFLSRERK